MSVWHVIIVSSVMTYLWRFLGALMAGKIQVDSPLFRYATCLSYAMVGALILKLILYPQGAIADVSLVSRLLATVAALVVFYLTRRNVTLGAWSGVIIFFIISLP